MTCLSDELHKFGDRKAYRRFPIVDGKIQIELKYLFAAMSGGCILRVLALLNNPAIEMDGIQYARAGEAFSAGRFGEGLSNVFSPGYPLFIALVHSVVPDLELAGRLVSVLFGTLLIGLAFFLGKKVLKDDGKAVWLSFLVAFHPYLVRYSGEVLSESLAIFLFTLAIFSFYMAWQENGSIFAVLSGLCLALTYLTRPEYLIFYIPLMSAFLWRRRIVDSALFLLPIVVLGSLYMLYLHSQTGLWIISNKATISPFVSLSAFFRNIPVVSLCFLEAISPLFLVFAVVGFRKTSVPYRNTLVLLIIFHILSLSFVGHATKRYSLEFVPLCLIAAVEGIYLAVPYLARFFKGRLLVYQVMIALIVAVSIFQAYVPMRSDRVLQKKAGLFLLSHDPGSTVAARLPIVAFYARGKNVDLMSELSTDRSIAHFNSLVTQKGIKYLILDEKIEKELPFAKNFLTEEKTVWSSGRKDSFITIYRL